MMANVGTQADVLRHEDEGVFVRLEILERKQLVAENDQHWTAWLGHDSVSLQVRQRVR